MTPADVIKYADGTLLILMFGFLFIIAIGLALESAWHWIQAIVAGCRRWRWCDHSGKDRA
jgi:hypothetical protein